MVVVATQHGSGTWPESPHAAMAAERSNMLDTTIGDTLATINVVREAFGHAPLTELPDAKTGDAADCLYYRALHDIGVESVSTGTMTFNSERAASTAAALWGTHANGNTVESPTAIRRVISAFDGNRLGHYNV